MIRQLPILRGLAILGVACNHATNRGYVAMFWWSHRYSDLPSPNFEQMGSIPYYSLMIIQQFTVFAVPAFLFISGFFASYAARGKDSFSIWKNVKVRIVNLIWPYIVWSVFFFLILSFQGVRHSFYDYLKGLVLGNIVGGYWFIPLLIQFYLLTPLILRVAKTIGHYLVFVSALVQLTIILLFYLDNFGIAPDVASYIGPWLCLQWALYFPLGFFCNLKLQRVSSWLRRFRLTLFFAALSFGTLSVFETEALFRLTENYGWAHSTLKLSTFLYSVCAIFFFLSLDFKMKRFKRFVERIGNKSYGIYLLNVNTLEFVSRSAYHTTPWLLSRQLFYQPVLIATGLGIPLLFMAGVAKSPAKKFYRILFG